MILMTIVIVDELIINDNVLISIGFSNSNDENKNKC